MYKKIKSCHLNIIDYIPEFEENNNFVLHKNLCGIFLVQKKLDNCYKNCFLFSKIEKYGRWSRRRKC